jgi:predicted DNA-binding ribbon-helix-helix protein
MIDINPFFIPIGVMKKYSVAIRGHRTSLTVEEPFWDSLREIAQIKSLSLAALIGEIDAQNTGNKTSLSSAVRVYVLEYYVSKTGQEK